MRLIKQICLAMATIIFAISCTPKHEGWILNASLENGGNGTVTIAENGNEEAPIKVQMVDGKFTAKGDILSEPKYFRITIEEKALNFGFFIENGEATYSATVTEDKDPYKKIKEQYGDKAESLTHEILDMLLSMSGATKASDGKFYTLNNPVLNASIANEHEDYVITGVNAIHRDKKFATNSSMPKEQREKIRAEHDKAVKDFYINFLKNNPEAYYSGRVVQNISNGITKEELAELVSLLSPNLKTSHAMAMRKKLAESKDVDVSEAITASNVSYKVDNNYDGSAFKNAIYLGTLSNNDLVALNKDKTVTIINQTGKAINSFVASTTSIPSTMAIDEQDNIFVLVPEEKEVEQTFRGKTTKRMQVVGYSCDIYDSRGNKIRSMKIEGVKQATGSRIANNKLLIADMGGRNIGVYNATTGVKETEIKDMRPCCGILDFSINDNNELLVANLGAFRVQSYDLTGKQILAFGTRGTGVSDFHGCCNPVSVAYLSNGAIVTVEKDPTRVKVFSKEGAIAIQGIDEMVKGCSYIPMIADSKDNLYLASPSKGVVKCVAI